MGNLIADIGDGIERLDVKISAAFMKNRLGWIDNNEGNIAVVMSLTKVSLSHQETLPDFKGKVS